MTPMMLLADQLQPIELTPPTGAPGSGLWAPPLWLIGASVIGLSLLVLVAQWRARRAAPVLERAFDALSRRLRIGRRRRRLLESLSRVTRVPAVALLISEHAFDRAALALDAESNLSGTGATREPAARPDALTDAALLGLRQTLFDADH